MAYFGKSSWASQQIDWQINEIHEPMPWWAVTVWLFYASCVVGVAIGWWQS